MLLFVSVNAKSSLKNSAEGSSSLHSTIRSVYLPTPEIIFEFILFNFFCCVAGESRVNSVIDETLNWGWNVSRVKVFRVLVSFVAWYYRFMILNMLFCCWMNCKSSSRSEMIERQIKRWRWDSTIRRTGIWSGAPSPSLPLPKHFTVDCLNNAGRENPWSYYLYRFLIFHQFFPYDVLRVEVQVLRKRNLKRKREQPSSIQSKLPSKHIAE